ncbi:RagB/SusD family nutrient uptake outer membrane protein [Chitinophaga sp. XS-30]|uniref:RagB/SusD family nutrient uptake outer membrane protein n=1 Tax=Chitinophaga sp. XS-30 TaxID=2604421 RepID=UPI0011DCCBE6|nr:RagB/SusD family nutrient uptake outer membrane protein [Chitinophaga sp. XS-30]QEH40620.1 RagB/SusD family nutrient uptake outer membrane protein [Chitinophaga sp. XS-30]
MKRYIIPTLMLISLSLVSCKKFLDVEAPKDKLVTATVFENDETAIATITGIYSRMYVESNNLLGYHLNFQFALLADELRNYSSGAEVVRVYTNSLNAANPTTPNYWQLGYNFIYNANSIYEGCENSKAMTPAVKKQIMAESLFVRAWWHFFLTNVYGDIPILTNTDYETNRIKSRSAQADVYKQVVADLVKAKSEISELYLAGNTIAASTDRVRPNKSVVSAFLARVYLYAGQYSEAEAEATTLITNTAQYKLSATGSTFLKSSTEAIWQLMTPLPSTTTANTFEALHFVLNTKPSSVAGTNCVTISSSLLAAFEATDKRKGDWIGKFTDNTVTPNVDYFYPAKYKSISTTVSTEYTTLLRLGEQFLIRAEARLAQNNLNGAAEDVTAIRVRAGLLPTTASDKPALTAAIAQERRLELFVEYGHRWFDLKRTNKINEVMEFAAPAKGSTWASYKQLFPIPIREVQSAPNLKQNLGYN